MSPYRTNAKPTQSTPEVPFAFRLKRAVRRQRFTIVKYYIAAQIAVVVTHPLSTPLHALAYILVYLGFAIMFNYVHRLYLDNRKATRRVEIALKRSRECPLRIKGCYCCNGLWLERAHGWNTTLCAQCTAFGCSFEEMCCNGRSHASMVEVPPRTSDVARLRRYIVDVEKR